MRKQICTLVAAVAFAACMHTGKSLPADAIARDQVLARRPKTDVEGMIHDMVMGRSDAAARLQARLDATPAPTVILDFQKMQLGLVP